MKMHVILFTSFKRITIKVAVQNLNSNLIFNFPLIENIWANYFMSNLFFVFPVIRQYTMIFSC